MNQEHHNGAIEVSKAVPKALVATSNPGENLLGLDAEGYAVVMESENARRLAAAWNACLPIPTEALESDTLQNAVKNVVEANQRLARENAHLQREVERLMILAGQVPQDKNEAAWSLISKHVVGSEIAGKGLDGLTETVASLLARIDSLYHIGQKCFVRQQDGSFKTATVLAYGNKPNYMMFAVTDPSLVTKKIE